MDGRTDGQMVGQKVFRSDRRLHGCTVDEQLDSWSDRGQTGRQMHCCTYGQTVRQMVELGVVNCSGTHCKTFDHVVNGSDAS